MESTTHPSVVGPLSCLHRKLHCLGVPTCPSNAYSSPSRMCCTGHCGISCQLLSLMPWCSFHLPSCTASLQCLENVFPLQTCSPLFTANVSKGLTAHFRLINSPPLSAAKRLSMDLFVGTRSAIVLLMLDNRSHSSDSVVAIDSVS